MLANFYADPEKLATPKDYILRVSAVSQKTLQNELSYVLANASSIVNAITFRVLPILVHLPVPVWHLRSPSERRRLIELSEEAERLYRKGRMLG